MIRLVAWLVYPFWRLWRWLNHWDEERKEEFAQWMGRWKIPQRALGGDSPLERRPYRVTAVDGISISGPATDFVGVAKRGEVIWIERGVADALIREGSIELVDE